MTVVARPIGPRLLVKPLEATEATAARVILPQHVRNRERRGMVLAVGKFVLGGDEDGMEYGPIDIPVGSTVVYPEGGGVEVTLDLNEMGVHEQLVVLHISEVLLVLEEVEASVGRTLDGWGG